jgi:phosphoglycolate phosphatase
MNLIFDFDGTLCDSLDTSILIANKYFALFGIPPTSSQEFRTLGLTGLLKSRHIPLWAAIFISPIAHWEFSRHLPHLKLFPWTSQIIPQLSNSHKLGILTNNSKQVVKSLLRRHQLNDYFSFVYSESQVFNKHNSLTKIINTYALDPRQTFYIGDALRDIEAAHKIGVSSVGVTWGLESDQLLASAHPTHLISNPNSLLTFT